MIDTFETAFSMDTSSIKFGPGVTWEVGPEMKQLGTRRVMVITDPFISEKDSVAITLKSLRKESIDCVLYDQVKIEPTDKSFKDAIRFASDGKFDGYVAVGGGSVIDTAKAANLYATYPADLLTYVNAPIGLAQPVPGSLKPLIAIPTTAGTGSETTGVAIFDLLEMRAKTGIAHRSLRPQMGLIDPNNTKTLPKMVAACTGFDVLCHALESLTALPFYKRQKPEHPLLRPAYQGANPISDIWVAKSIQMVSQNILKVIDDPQDERARSQMMLAATFAGIGFGNAGVHLPHGMSYPISGMVRNYHVEGYPEDHPLIPHGMSVILSAPAVFRFTARADPARHLYAASLLGVDTTQIKPEQAGEALAQQIISLMYKAGMPNGLREVGYCPEDIDLLVEGTLPQHRVTKLSPLPVTEVELRQLFRDSLTLW